ncbi:MAG: Gfo/Idh/MocA family protein, partial [Bacteroidia bacterium]
EKAADYARRHQVPKWYDDADQLINDPDINAVYVATPPLQHEAYTIAALAAGKDVYVEKPMAIDALSAQRMVDAATKYNSKLSIAHYRRAQPLFSKVKELLDENAIGDIRLVQLKMLQAINPSLVAQTASNWRMDPAVSGGGLFHDLAPHQLDLMTYYFGPIRKVQGFATRQQEQTVVDDLVVGDILFESGVVFNGAWCFSVSPDEQADFCEIYGSKGKISFPMFGHHLQHTLNGVMTEHKFEPLAHVQQPMIAKVVDYFLDQGPNPCTGEEAVLTMEIMDSFTAKL